jgi:hypothetical protein
MPHRLFPILALVFLIYDLFIPSALAATITPLPDLGSANATFGFTGHLDVNVTGCAAGEPGNCGARRKGLWPICRASLTERAGREP